MFLTFKLKCGIWSNSLTARSDFPLTGLLRYEFNLFMTITKPYYIYITSWERSQYKSNIKSQKWWVKFFSNPEMNLEISIEINNLISGSFQFRRQKLELEYCSLLSNQVNLFYFRICEIYRAPRRIFLSIIVIPASIASEENLFCAGKAGSAMANDFALAKQFLVPFEPYLNNLRLYNAIQRHMHFRQWLMSRYWILR